MKDNLTPDAVEQEFFAALIGSSVETLDRVLADDFVLIDVMTGSEISKAMLLEVIGAGQLKFEDIDRVEFRVRLYETAAVVNGRTEMKGSFAGEAFSTSSRYTHVYIEQHGHWRMVAAQGTPISSS
jgi:hypothetical protein